MFWARIEDGIVRETTDIDPAGRFHPSLVWVPCAAEVTFNWTYIDGVFAPPAE